MSYGHDFTHHCVCFICMTVLYYHCSIDAKTSVFKSTTVKFYHGKRLVELSTHSVLSDICKG